MLRGLVSIVVVFSFGCLQSQSTQCDDRVCPRDTTCHPVLGCVTEGQVEACRGQPDGMTCTYPGVVDGLCAGELCRPRGCGNGAREVTNGEDCDGADIGDATCASEGYYRGTLGCTASCRYDTTTCAGICGDGIADTSNGEMCDTADLGTASCETLGFYGGTLACLPNCQPNLIGCQGLCGDGAKTGSETCDGSDFGGKGCSDFGRYTGTLACSQDCSTVDIAGCSGFCGDLAKNGAELCDSNDLGGYTCQTLGYYGGLPACAGSCDAVTKGTCAGYCGDGIVNGNELCDGTKQNTLSCTSFAAGAGALGCDGYCQRTFDRCFYGDGWRQSVSPTTSNIFDIVALSADEIWAVGESGLVMRGNGQTWTTFDANTFSVLESVWPRTSSDVWAVGGNGTIRHFDGTTWTSYASGTTELLTGVWGASATNVWATSLFGKILHFDGTSWTTVFSTSTDELWDVWGTSATDVWFTGRDTTSGNTGALLLHWNGSVFGSPIKFAGLGAFEGIWGSSPTDIWATGTGNFAHYTGTWAIVSTPITNYMRDIRGTSANDIWAVGEQGAVAHYNGVSWSYVTSSIETALFAVAPVSPGDAWAGGMGGVIGRWLGTGWTTVASNTTAASLLDVFGLGANDVWAVGDAGKAVHWNGIAWTESDTGAANTLYGVWGSETNNVFAVGGFPGSGKIARYTGTWSSSVVGTATLYGVSGTDANHIWAVGEGGTIMFWNGTSWTPQTSNLTTVLWAVWAISPTDVWAVGDSSNSGVNAGMGATHWNGTSWTPVDTGFNSFRALWASAGGDVWATGMGHLYHWDTGVWNSVTQPSNAFFQAIWGIGPDDVFTSSDVLHWDGATWTQMVEPPHYIQGLWGAAGDDLWGVGQTPNEIYHWGGTIPRAAGGACSRPIPLYCGTRVTGSNAGAVARFNTYSSCAGSRTDTGGEVAYRFDDPVTGTITFDLTPIGADLDLVVLDDKADTTCDPAVCLAASQTAGTGVEHIVRNVTQGDVLHVLVDGFAGAVGGYALQVTCTKP